MTMKVTINTTAPKERDVDWSKPMVVVSSEGKLVFTDGSHKNECFSGVAFIGGTEYRTDWIKKYFTPCTTPVTITFENEL